MVGFMFLLRARELSALAAKGIKFEEQEAEKYVRIFIRKSKTDQEVVGVFRSSNETGAEPCPYRWRNDWVAKAAGEDRDKALRGEGIPPPPGHAVDKMGSFRSRFTTGSLFNTSIKIGGEQPACTIHGLTSSISDDLGGGNQASLPFIFSSAIKILKNLPTCLVRCEGLTSQLRVCTVGTQNLAFDKIGGMAQAARNTQGGQLAVGQPTSHPMEKRVGSRDRTKSAGWPLEVKREKANPPRMAQRS